MKKIRLVSLLVLLVLFSVNIYYLFFDKQSYISVLEAYLSRDHHIENPALIFISIQGAFFLATVPCVWIGTNQSFFKDVHKVDRITFITIISLFVLYHVVYYVPSFFTVLLPFPPFQLPEVGNPQLFAEDNLFESLTVVIALVSSFLIFKSIKMKKGRIPKLALSIIALLYFVFAMEEISWGQRVFNWETPNAWRGINTQEETNIHNVLPFSEYFYSIFNYFVAIFMISVKKLQSKIEKYSTDESFLNLLPYRESPFYALIFFILSFQCFLRGGELTEETLALIGLSYAIKQRYVFK